jgi:hypothetical protein
MSLQGRNPPQDGLGSETNMDSTELFEEYNQDLDFVSVHLPAPLTPTVKRNTTNTAGGYIRVFFGSPL